MRAARAADTYRGARRNAARGAAQNAERKASRLRTGLSRRDYDRLMEPNRAYAAGMRLESEKVHWPRVEWLTAEGERLRAIRAKNGISRPPALALARLNGLGWYPAEQINGEGVLWYRSGISNRAAKAAARTKRFLAEIFGAHRAQVVVAE